MSSTSRGGQRSEADAYDTPAFAVHRLLDELILPQGMWLEPAGGTGCLIRAVNDYRQQHSQYPVDWRVIELRKECRPALDLVTLHRDHVVIASALSGADPFREEHPKVIITNPPFSLAEEFLEAGFRYQPEVLVLLLRLNFLGSAKRARLLKDRMPDVYVLPNRISFDNRGTDSVEYAWMVFHPREPHRGKGIVKILDTCPLEERKRPE